MGDYHQNTSSCESLEFSPPKIQRSNNRLNAVRMQLLTIEQSKNQLYSSSIVVIGRQRRGGDSTCRRSVDSGTTFNTTLKSNKIKKNVSFGPIQIFEFQKDTVKNIDGIEIQKNKEITKCPSMIGRPINPKEKMIKCQCSIY